MTYDELVTAIRDYMEIDSGVLTDAIINTFILLTENRIMRDVDLDVFKKEADTTLNEASRFLAFPTDFLAQRYLLITVNGEQIVLDFRDQSFMKEYWPDSSEQGVPKYYALFDDTNFYLAPTPDADYVAQLGYIARPAQLSSSNTETWISKNAPEALLYGCLLQAYSFTKGPLEMVQLYERNYAQAIQALGLEQQGRRRRDEYRDGMIRLPIRSESPGPAPKR
jgi:hypothetical protein